MRTQNDTYNRKLWFAAFFGVGLTFLVLTSDLWALRYIFKWDAWNQFWPWFHYLAEALRSGKLPLWEPHACCGFPYHADPTTGTFNPVYIAVAYLFGGSYQVFQYLWLSHWLVGLAGFFFLARKMGFGPAGTFVGAITFGFNGFFIGNAEHTYWIMALGYFPWILLLLEESFESNVLYAVPAGALFGLVGPGINLGIYMAVMIACWCFLRKMQFRKPALVLVIVFLVAALVLSPSFLPFLAESDGYTDRASGLSVENACNTHRFLMSGLVSLIAPALTVNYPGDLGSNIPNVPMMNVYLGIFGLVSLWLVASTESLRKRWTWLLVFVVIAFLFSLGTTGGLRVLGYYILPPLRYVRHSSLFRAFWLFGGALLSAAVADKMLSGSEDERKRLFDNAFRTSFVILYAAFAAFCWAWLVPTVTLVYEFREIFPVPNSLFTALELVGPQIVLAALFGAAFCLNASPQRGRIFATFLLLLVVADAAVHVHTNKATICWNGQAVELSSELERRSVERKGVPLSGEEKRGVGPVHTNFGIFDGKFYVRSYLPGTAGSYDFLVGGTWPPVQDTGFLDTLVNGPRWWLSPKVVYAPADNKEALAFLRDKNSQSGLPIFLHSETAAAGSSTTSEFVKPGTYGNVRVLSYQAEEVLLTVNAPDRCWLFTTERYAPGWKAYVDGEEATVFKANFCFRALAIPKGLHTVKMEYMPTTYRAFAVLSWATTFVALVVLGLLTFKRCRRGLSSEWKRNHSIS